MPITGNAACENRDNFRFSFASIKQTKIFCFWRKLAHTKCIKSVNARKKMLRIICSVIQWSFFSKYSSSSLLLQFPLRNSLIHFAKTYCHSVIRGSRRVHCSVNVNFKKFCISTFFLWLCANRDPLANCPSFLLWLRMILFWRILSSKIECGDFMSQKTEIKGNALFSPSWGCNTKRLEV